MIGMGAWNVVETASKKDIMFSQRQAVCKLQGTMEDILEQQKLLREQIDRKAKNAQATHKQIREDIAALRTEVERMEKLMMAMEEFIRFAIANKMIDSLEGAVEKMQGKVSKSIKK